MVFRMWPIKFHRCSVRFDFEEKLKSVLFFFSLGIVQIEGWVSQNLNIVQFLENGMENAHCLILLLTWI